MKPPTTLFDAYYRSRVGEDRTTEVFSAVLGGVPELVAALAAKVGLEVTGEFTIETQVRFDGRRSIDLEIRSADPGNPWILWAEHKVGDLLGTDQLRREVHALDAKADGLAHRLIAITLYPLATAVREEAESLGVERLSWSDIGALARRAGVTLAGPTWDVLARSAGATVPLRMLSEWCDYASHELEEVRVDSLTSRAVEILPEAVRAQVTIDHLLEFGLSAAAGQAVDAVDEWHAAAPQATWLDVNGFEVYARADFDPESEDFPLALREGVPVLVVGAWVEAADAVRIRGGGDLLTHLTDLGFDFENEPGKRGGWFGIVRSLPISAIAATDGLEAQQQVVASFCSTTIGDLVAAGPMSS